MTDYMKEAERMLNAFIDASNPTLMSSDDAKRTLAALLAHFQRGAPDGWKEATIAWEVCASIHREYAKKKDPFFSTRQADFVRHTETARAAMLAAGMVGEPGAALHSRGYEIEVPAGPDPLHLSRILHELAAAASLCWEPRPTGVFDSQLAIQFVEQALAEIRSRMTPTPAEVPMPEPVAYGFGNTAITGHTNRLMMVRIDIPGGDQYAGAFWLPLVLADEARTYGERCHAAGEAAGYARGLADERERCASVAWAHYMDTCRRKGIGPDVLPDWCCAAALRGEVK